MSESVIKVEGLSKCYQLGAIGRHTLVDEAQHLWCKLRGKDPHAELGKVGGSSVPQQSDKEFWALKDVSFEVQPGEILGVIGGNGAGKSTLLKILSRITEPSSGTATIRGRVGSLLEVGTGFHPELTGRENVFMNGTILGMRKHEVMRKFDEIVAFSGIEKFIDTPVKRYSSGMYVRLAFAVAAHLEPEILIVDEVLAVGDAEFQKRCLGKMGEVAKEGRTVLFVSHNMAAINSLCSSCLLLRNGKVQSHGETQKIIQTYLMSDNIESTINEDLLIRDHRKGSGEIRFAEFHTEDSEGMPRQQFQSGERICFTFRLKSPSYKQLEKVDVGFSIHDYTSGSILSVLYSSYQNIVFDLEGDTTTVRCWVNDFPFSAARYLIGARLIVDGEESDWLQEKIGFIDIIEGDFYSTGQKGYRGNAPLLLRGDWEQTKQDTK